MTVHSVAVFLHVVGAFGLFFAMGLEWVCVARLLQTDTVEQSRDWLGLFDVIRRVSPASLAVLLIAGLYMAVTAWGSAGWIVVGFAALLLLPPLGMINGLRLPAIKRDLPSVHGPLPDALRHRLHDPLFLVSIQIRTAIALGIVFLMTTKPDLTGSVTAIVVAIALGVAFSLPALNRARGDMKTA